jgi:hypothetical protein
VPYISAPKGDPEKGIPADPAKRYYFCGRLIIPVAVYLPYLIATKDALDAEVNDAVTNTLTQEDMLLSMQLEHESVARVMYPESVRRLFLNKCINKMREEGLNQDALATLFCTTSNAVRAAVTKIKKVVNQDRQPVTRFQSTPEYAAIKKAANNARIKASGMGIRYEFILSDVFPTMYDIQGNSGRQNGELILPRVCPVLRVPLDYDTLTNNKALNKVRVWRKTPGPDGTAPMDKDNIIIMSTIAAWAIEGAYAVRKLEYLSHDMQMALKEWQGKYGTRTVPREGKIGRPRKA